MAPHPLFTAISAGKLEECMKHVEWVGRRNKFGVLPIHFACKKGHADIVWWLLNNGAKVDSVVDGKITPMDSALAFLQFAVCDVLFDFGADINPDCVFEKFEAEMELNQKPVEDVLCDLSKQVDYLTKLSAEGKVHLSEKWQQQVNAMLNKRKQKHRVPVDFRFHTSIDDVELKSFLT